MNENVVESYKEDCCFTMESKPAGCWGDGRPELSSRSEDRNVRNSALVTRVSVFS